MKRINSALLIALLICACASKPAVNPDEVSLNTAIRQAATRMETRLGAGTKVALVNFTSPSQSFSEYVLDELSSVLVNDGILTVVDRANLDRIRQELGLNTSGEVSEMSMQKIGQMLGAQALVTGSLTSIADLRRVMFKVIITETAAVAVQHPADITNDRRVQALLAQGGGSSGVNYGAASAGSQGSGGGAASGGKAAAPAQAATYKIGDTGPTGGLIFYDKGNNRDGWRYLEAAPVSTERELFNTGSPYSDGAKDRVGDGLENTRSRMARIEKEGGGINSAPWYCTNLEVNGFKDWYLPAFDEIVLMYTNLYLNNLGNFRQREYWHSSQQGVVLGAYDFATGERRHGYGYENDKRLVRPCRRF